MPAPIVYVWLGAQLPCWAADSISITRKANHNREIILVCQRDLCNIPLAIDRPLHLDHSEVSKIEKNFEARSLNTGIFWKNTSLRIPALKYACAKYGIQKFMHLELDCIASDLEGLDLILDSIAIGLFAPRDGIERGIGSLIYCNSPQELDALISYYKEPWSARNDMHALGLYLRYKPYVYSLPTESYLQTSPLWKSLSPEKIGYIFDAAAIGQYCLGIDPANCKYRPLRNLFINENSYLDWKEGFHLEFSSNTWKIYLNEAKEHLKLANLHCHSKNFNKARELLNSGPVYQRMTRRQSSIISGRHKYLYGWLLYLRDKLIMLVGLVTGRHDMSLKRRLSKRIRNSVFCKSRFEPNNSSRLSSFPYISGDLFFNLSQDYILQNGQYNLPTVSHDCSGRVLFVEASLLSSKEIRNHAKNYKVILIHNGDDWNDEHTLSELYNGKNYIFATNSLKTGFSEPLPIGIENAHHGENGSLHYYYHRPKFFSDQLKRNIVLVSFNINTNIFERSRIQQLCDAYGYPNKSYNTYSYRQNLRISMFIISPPGNGIDCHRTWEAFYHRTVPVIERRFYLFEHLDLPVFICDSTADFLALSNSQKEDIYAKIWSREYPAIYGGWWIHRIMSALN